MRCDDYCSIDKVGLKNCKERISTVTEDDLDYLALQFHNIVRIMTIELNKKSHICQRIPTDKT